MKYLAAFAFLCGCQSAPVTPRECLLDIADAQMRALVQGVQLCADAACVESEIRQRVIIMADYSETCVQTEVTP